MHPERPYNSVSVTKGLLRKPDPMKILANQRNHYKYCDIHEDVRHNTSECYSLHNQIEGLVRGDSWSNFYNRYRIASRRGKRYKERCVMRKKEERIRTKI